MSKTGLFFFLFGITFFFSRTSSIDDAFQSIMTDVETKLRGVFLCLKSTLKTAVIVMISMGQVKDISLHRFFRKKADMLEYNLPRTCRYNWLVFKWADIIIAFTAACILHILTPHLEFRSWQDINETPLPIQR